MKLLLLAVAVILSSTIRGSAQSTNQPATTPTPQATPAMAGPLQAAPPIVIDAGPVGKLDLDGVVTGMGLLQDNHAVGDNTAQAAQSNGQIFIQKSSGWWQFYVQAGAYNVPTLGVPFLSTGKTITDF